jgi:hypothetical protein
MSDAPASIRPVMDEDNGTGDGSVCAVSTMDASSVSPSVRPTMATATHTNNSSSGVTTVTGVATVANVSTSIRMGGDTICAIFS